MPSDPYGSAFWDLLSEGISPGDPFLGADNGWYTNLFNQYMGGGNQPTQQGGAAGGQRMDDNWLTNLGIGAPGTRSGGPPQPGLEDGWLKSLLESIFGPSDAPSSPILSPNLIPSTNPGSPTGGLPVADNTPPATGGGSPPASGGDYTPPVTPTSPGYYQDGGNWYSPLGWQMPSGWEPGQSLPATSTMPDWMRDNFFGGMDPAYPPNAQPPRQDGTPYSPTSAIDPLTGTTGSTAGGIGTGSTIPPGTGTTTGGGSVIGSGGGTSGGIGGGGSGGTPGGGGGGSGGGSGGGAGGGSSGTPLNNGGGGLRPSDLGINPLTGQPIASWGELNGLLNGQQQFNGQGTNNPPAAPASGGGGGGGGNVPTTPQQSQFSQQGLTLLNNLYSQFQNAYTAGRTANNNRYNLVMQGYLNREAQGQQLVNQLGNSELADINRRYDAQAGGAYQSAIGRGLGNTTVADSLQRGVQSDRNVALAQATNQIQQQRLSTYAGLKGDTLGFMERRTDTYPDMGMLANLALQIGAAGAGQPGTQAQVGAQYQTVGGNGPPRGGIGGYYTSGVNNLPGLGGQRWIADSTYAQGGIVDEPEIAMVGEGDAPEVIIPTDPKHRQRALALWKEAGRRLGVKGFAAGGIMSSTGSFSPVKTFTGVSDPLGSLNDPQAQAYQAYLQSAGQNAGSTTGATQPAATQLGTGPTTPTATTPTGTTPPPVSTPSIPNAAGQNRNPYASMTSIAAADAYARQQQQMRQSIAARLGSMPAGEHARVAQLLVQNSFINGARRMGAVHRLS